MSKSLLITGGCGFIGSNFVHKRVIAGDKVIILDSLTYAGRKENLAGLSGYELVIGDIGNGALVSDLLQKHKIDAVINFAAESHVDRSIQAPARFIETNVKGTFTLLTAAFEYWQKLPSAVKKDQFRFVQISTDEVFGSLLPPGRFNEESPYRPNSPYSASKAAADHLVRAWNHTYGLPTITTNCTNNYGPRQHREKLIPHMIACALSGQPLPLYGDGNNIRDWIHVNDQCEGVWLALTRGRPGASYCFGGNAERTNIEVVTLICQTLDQLNPRPDGKPHSSAISFVSDRPGHDRRYAIDDSLARRELGFVRKHDDFEARLVETVKWYLGNS